jgi:two-component system sensor histidine kinase PilS (NtrC family)
MAVAAEGSGPAPPATTAAPEPAPPATKAAAAEPAPPRAQATTRPDEAARRVRLTYVMALRVGLVTLLLLAALVAELGAPLGSERAPIVDTLWGLIAATYGLTIVFALVLSRTQRVTELAVAQIAGDLLLTTMLVHVTGGADSGFAFMYLLVVIGAAFVLPRGALAVAAAAVTLYVCDGLVDAALPLRTLIRTLAVNVIAFAATGALATRLALELERAGAQVASQGVLLRDLAAVHEHVVRGLTSGLVTVDREGRVLTLNNAAATILDRPADLALGRPITEVMPGIAPLLALAGDGRLRRGEALQPVRVGDAIASRTLGVSVSPLVDSLGRVLGRILNFQDLTEVRRLEAAVLRAERLAAVGRLAAGVAHEIRNPLAAISGSIELLSQSMTAASESTRENRELMGIVMREVERLNRLITDLLAFARPRPPETQRLDVTATLGEMLKVFENDRGMSGTRVALQAGAAVWIDADAGQLRQVMWNLLRNAAEAKPGEEIAVEVDGDDAWVRIRVRDRGPGIPVESRARLGEPFFSTKEGGTGLGLATVHRIVEEHRGSVEIDCPREGGTVVTIRLPAAAGGAPS